MVTESVRPFPCPVVTGLQALALFVSVSGNKKLPSIHLSPSA